MLQFKMVNTRSCVLLFFYIIPVALIICGCSKSKTSRWWPESGNQVKHIQWQTDTANTRDILHTINGVWTLPEPPLNNGTNNSTISQTSYIASIGKSSIMGSVDQVAGHHSGQVVQEYFRFDNGNVLLAGIKSADSSRLYTIYDPPIILMPAQLSELDTVLTSTTRPLYYNEITGMQSQGPQMYVEIERLETGRVMYKGEIIDAVECKISISQDQEMNIQGSTITLPKLHSISNHLLVARDLGVLLEWGVRKKAAQYDKNKNNINSAIQPESKLEIILHEHRTI